MPSPDDLQTVQSVHPVSAHLINNKDQHCGLVPIYAAKPADHPEVQEGVLELEALFAESLTPQEVAFHNPPKVPKPRISDIPRNFLQVHMVIIDALLMNPGIRIAQLSKDTGYSQSWLHKVMSSDAFQAKLFERQKALVDPIIMASITDRLRGLASRTLEIVEERMDGDEVPLAAALEVFSVAAKALGLGQQKNAPVVAQQFIVHVPPRIQSAVSWAEQHSGRPAETVVDPLDLPEISEAEFKNATED